MLSLAARSRAAWSGWSAMAAQTSALAAVTTPSHTSGQIVQRRRIFSDEYLGMGSFVRKRNSVRLGLVDHEEFVRDVRKTFDESGMRNLFADDLSRLVDAADGEEDTRLAGEILRTCLRQDEGGRRINDLPKFVSRFFSACKFNNYLAAATEMWNAPEIEALTRNLRSVRVKYLALLYQNGLYQEVVDAYKALGCEVCSLDDATLALASLYRMDTDEAFKQATEIVHSPPVGAEAPTGDGGNRTWSKKPLVRKEAAGCRGIYIYAYFAFKKGELGTAYDMLTDRRYVSRPNRLCTTIKLTILTEVGRVPEALQVIKAELLPPPLLHVDAKRRPPRRKHVCFETMQGLAKVIKEKQDPGSEVAKEFASMCKTLDETAVLLEESVEEMLLSPIMPISRPPSSFSRKRQSGRRAEDDDGDWHRDDDYREEGEHHRHEEEAGYTSGRR